MKLKWVLIWWFDWSSIFIAFFYLQQVSDVVEFRRVSWKLRFSHFSTQEIHFTANFGCNLYCFSCFILKSVHSYRLSRWPKRKFQHNSEMSISAFDLLPPSVPWICIYTMVIPSKQFGMMLKSLFQPKKPLFCNTYQIDLHG